MDKSFNKALEFNKSEFERAWSVIPKDSDEIVKTEFMNASSKEEMEQLWNKYSYNSKYKNVIE